MKVGIVTFHRAENFGAMLQAVALRTALTQLGHEAYFIDYWPKAHAAVYQSWSTDEFKHRSLASKCVYLAKNLILGYPMSKRHRNFEQFLNENISPYCLPVDAEIDVAIYGSDQVWGRFSFLGSEFDSFFFGNNSIKTARHISYAASMGNSQINEAESLFLVKHLTHFEKIGVREADVRDLLSSIGLNNVSLTCDPTLLIDGPQWRKMLKPERVVKKPYILFYNLLGNSFDVESIKQIAKQRGLRLIMIRGVIDRRSLSRDEMSAVGPEKFLRLIRDAEFVFTSSFHGLAFSILFQKDFYASYSSKAARAQTLLSSIGLEDRLLAPMSDLNNYPLTSIDYTSPSQRLGEYSAKSREFLAAI